MNFYYYLHCPVRKSTRRQLLLWLMWMNNLNDSYTLTKEDIWCGNAPVGFPMVRNASPAAAARATSEKTWKNLLHPKTGVIFLVLNNGAAPIAVPIIPRPGCGAYG